MRIGLKTPSPRHRGQSKLLTAILKEVFEDLGLELHDKKDKWGTSYSAIINNDWELSMSLGSRTGNPMELDIELNDLIYPPDQGQMAGGYSIAPWIMGTMINLCDPNAIDDLKSLVTDPCKYLGDYNRDCQFGDHKSKLHKDPNCRFLECYHDDYDEGIGKIIYKCDCSAKQVRVVGHSDDCLNEDN